MKFALESGEKILMLNYLLKIYVQIIGFLFYGLIVLVNKTLRLEIIGADNYYNLHNSGQKIVFVFWHQASFIPIYHYRHQGACILTMTSLRGQILAQAARLLGYQVVLMAKEDDPKSLRQLYKLALAGHDCNLAVDGPLGPRHKVKPGALFLAQKLKRAILPITAAAKPCLTFTKRWDRYFLPLPFSRAVLILGGPIYAEGELEVMRDKCEQILISQSLQAIEQLT